MQVREVMTGDVRCAEPTMTVVEAAKMMQDFNVGSIPVCEGEQLIGMITDRDIAIRCVAQGQNPTQCKVNDHMSQDVVTAEPSMSVEEALTLMSTGRIRRLPVVENNLLVGIVSLGDLSVETQGQPQVASSLTEISQPVHQTEGGQPKVAAA